MILLADSQENLYALTDSNQPTPANLWRSSQASGYTTWLSAGPVNIGNKRSGFGAYISKDDILYLGGGDQGPPFQVRKAD